jgi:hypothetical protein
MKVLVFVKATPNSEKGIFPPDADKMFAEMGAFNERLVKAGIMQEADGLKPSSAGKRIKFSDNGTPTVIDGPFAETKELVAGYWVWNVKSLDEAIEWAKQCPNPMPGDEGVLEIRPCYAMEDFADIAPKEEFEREARLRKEVSRQKKAKSTPKAKAKSKAKAKAKAAPARKKSAPGTAKRRPARAKAKK